MTATPCGACGAPTPDQAHLCQGDTQRLRGALADIPALLAELDTTRTRQTVAPAAAIGDDPCQHDGDCGCGVSLPWDDRASRVAHGLRNALTTWSQVLIEQNPDEASSAQAEMPQWLTSKLGDIRHQPWAPDMLADLTKRIRDAEQAIDRPEDRLYAGPCGGTITISYGISDQCRRRIWARPEETAVKCRTCGTLHIVADRQAFMLTAAADLEMPGPQICSVLTTMLRVLVKRSTFRSWVHRGKITKRGERDGADTYRFGDALDLWRAGDRGDIPA